MRILFLLTTCCFVLAAGLAQPRPNHADTLVNRAREFALAKNLNKAFQALDSAAAIGYFKHKLLETDPHLELLRKDPRYKTLHERILNNAYPCRILPEARTFDFWLGEWDVYATASTSFKTGVSSITRASQGCVILENWHAVGPHEGMSMNYFDPSDKKWKQMWVGSGQDIQEFYDGEYVDNAMRFKFTGRNPDGTTFAGRLTFSNLPSGKVRQHSERTDDDGKTWQTLYDFTYVRKADGATP